MRTHVLIIGAGIAGLSVAHYLAQAGITSLVITKSNSIATKWAKGGIAVALSNTDSIECHRHDTLVAGAGRCDAAMVNLLVQDGPDRLRDLIKMGVNFDRDATGYHFGQEAAHQHRRILHVGDQTGKVIHGVMYQAVLDNPLISVHESLTVTGLLMAGNQCRGAIVYDQQGKQVIIHANAVVMASGGAGYSYQQTSVPAGYYGDGIFLAQSVGATIRDMAFVQFHPTLLYGSQFLISEVVRGEGAQLCDWSGNAIMAGKHLDGDLAPRDHVSRELVRAIGDQPHAWLDMTSCRVPIETRFPALYAHCVSQGLDPYGRLPVIPAAHYTMGGIQTDQYGCTTVLGLYAVGEVASTRVHGANRLASNSLLEGLVFGQRVAQHYSNADILSGYSNNVIRDIPLPPDYRLSHNQDSHRAITRIRKYMSTYAGIIRTHTGLQTMQDYLDNHPPTDQFEHAVIHRVACNIVSDSLAQSVNCGSFFCEDLATC